MTQMLEPVMPYLMRAVTDKEAQLGAGIISDISRLGGDGLTDGEAEVGIMCAIAMYAEHRREMGDTGALDRIRDGAAKLYQSRRFRMRVGEDFTRMVQGEAEAGRL